MEEEERYIYIGREWVKQEGRKEKVKAHSPTPGVDEYTFWICQKTMKLAAVRMQVYIFETSLYATPFKKRVWSFCNN